MKRIVVRREWLWGQMAAAFVAAFILAYVWGAIVLHTDAQAGIAYLMYLPVCPGICAFFLGFAEHRWKRLVLLTAVSSAGATAAALTWSSGIDAIPCLTTYGAMMTLLALIPAGIGLGISSCFYRLVPPDGWHCLACGYSLVGLESDRCPECGWAIDFAALGTTRERLREAARTRDTRGG
jgi:hypothetical protein